MSRPIRLAYEGPLDWPLLLGYFASRAIGGVESVDLAALAYRRTVVIGDEPDVLDLRQDDGAIVARLESGRTLPRERLPRARAVFALDRDPRPGARHLAGDPDLAPLIAAQPGLRVPGTWDPYETGVRAIVGQQVSVAGASTVTARIVQRVGTPLREPSGSLTHAFPGPDALAGADLSGIGMPGSRVAAIQAFAAAVATGDVVLDTAHPTEELLASVCAIRGLGPWTAGYIAIRTGHPDAFPAADLGLRKAWRPGAVLTTRELEARAEAWRPHRSHAAVVLWLSL